MVLDNATTSADTPFTDNEVPASDVDQYSSASSSTDGRAQILAQPPPNRILIPFDQLPKVKPFLAASSTGAIQDMVAVMVRQRCDAAAKILHRPVRQEEAEAFAVNTAHGVRLSLYGTPIGRGLGFASFVRTYNTGAFPGGWYPGKNEGSKFSLDRLGPLQGAPARFMWHAARMVAYVGLFGLAGSVFFGTYGLSVLTVRISADPRLKDYNEALRVAAAIKKAPVRDQDTSSTTQAETFEQRRQRRSIQAQARTPVQQKTSFDDASPTGGSFQNDYLDYGSQSEMMSDAQSARRDEQAWRSSESSTEKPLARASPTNPPQSENPFDTVSSDSSAPGKQSGSAWDRLRQQALDGKSTPKPSDRNA